MKILFVDLKYDYGKKSRGINLIGENGFHQSFKRLGHNVDCFYYDDYLDQLDLLQKLILEKADLIKPDLIYFILFQNQFYPETLNQLKSKYKTMNWFGDDQWRFETFTSTYAPCFTYCVTTDFLAISKYKSININQVVLSQWAAINQDHHFIENPNYKFDVSFIGGFHPYRKWFIQKLEEKGLKIQTYGNGWTNESLTFDDMNDLFQNSKINLNISNSTSLNMSYLLNHPKNIINLFRTNKSSSQIKARNFEIPYAGGFELSDYVPFLENYFHIGKEIACYSSVNEAEQLIRYYIENNELRERIRKNGWLIAKKFHSYDHRHQEIFKILNF